MSKKEIKVFLKKNSRAAGSANSSGYLWKDVLDVSEKIPPGTVVEVFDPQKEWVCKAFYNGHARVRLRWLTSDPNEVVDQSFFEKRIRTAFSFRRRLLLMDHSNAIRIVNSEGDFLSGLIVDLFNDVLVVEYKCAGMYRFHSAIQGILERILPGKKQVYVCDAKVQKQESFNFKEKTQPIETEIHEQGIRFSVLAGGGHKTGFFLDQRANRAAFAQLTQEQNVLDLCSYTGGFSLWAKKNGGAKSVVAVDHDPEVVSMLDANANKNGVSIQAVQEDVFAFLKRSVHEQKKWGAVVLDPWRMTRSAQHLPLALNSYEELNTLALKVVEDGGIFLTCSCTGNVSEEVFLETVSKAAKNTNRMGQVFRLSGADTDHPVSLFSPQGRYLKAVWMNVLG